MLKKIGVSLLATAALSSCATIAHGTRQSIGIASNPSNAAVWLDNAYIGNTPLIAQMSRKDNHFVRIHLEGYLPYEVTFTKRLSGWVFGNIVFGGVIGIAVDAVSGAIYKLTPDQVQAELRTNHIVRSERSQDSYIAIVLQPDPQWEKIGNLVAVAK